MWRRCAGTVLGRRTVRTIQALTPAGAATGSPRSSSCAPGGSKGSPGEKSAKRSGAAGFARPSASGSGGCAHRGREACAAPRRVRSSGRRRSPGELEEDVHEVVVVALVAVLVQAAPHDRAPFLEDDDPIAELIDVLEKVSRDDDRATLPADL